MKSTFRLRFLLRRMDWVTLSAMILLTVTGIVFIYSACYRGDQLPVAPFYRRQILWVMIGLLLYGAAAFIDYHRLLENSLWLYLLGIVLLVLVLVAGKRVYGASRWLAVFGFQLQPSEFAKIAVILLLSRYLGRPGQSISDPRVTFNALLLVGVPFVLIALQPDLGTAAVMVPPLLAMLFVAGAAWRILAFLGVAGLSFLPLGWLMLGAYQRERMMVFFDPGRDPLGAGWNKIQSAIAVGSGGLSGKGFLEGTQNVLGFLPRTVAPTDFIFSVIAEETGFIGATLVLVLFAVVFSGFLRAALRARDRAGRLMVVGLSTMLFCHVFINIAMTLGMFPITGLPLPLISYGGSFMFVAMLSFGLIQSVFIRRGKR